MMQGSIMFFTCFSHFNGVKIYWRFLIVFFYNNLCFVKVLCGRNNATKMQGQSQTGENIHFAEYVQHSSMIAPRILGDIQRNMVCISAVEFPAHKGIDQRTSLVKLAPKGQIKNFNLIRRMPSHADESSLRRTSRAHCGHFSNVSIFGN